MLLLGHHVYYLVVCTIDHTVKLEGFSPLTLLLIRKVSVAVRLVIVCTWNFNLTTNWKLIQHVTQYCMLH